jgi:Flp pilus assembly protein TadG
MRRDKRREKGFAIIYVALIGAFVLIPMAGLAIDFGVVYNVKARLQTACDAAAIGAGYLLHATTDLSNQTQYDAITSAAQEFFNANYSTHYMGSTVTSYTAVATSSTAGKTITVNATATVPMLFMRVLGIANSQVAAMAVSNVRYIAMMIVVDRSGSIYSEGGPGMAVATQIQSTLNSFVADSTVSYLKNGVDTVGMVSFGGTWNEDFTPSTNFQSGSATTIGTAITNIPFCNDSTGATSSTNTAEGLYQAWYNLYSSQMNLPGALNVILLLTDGRPSAFTSYWTPDSHSSCTNKTQRGGVFETYVSLGSYPFWPPPSSGTDSTGLYVTQFNGLPETSTSSPNNVAQPSGGCAYDGFANVGGDFSNTFPSSVGPVDNVGSGAGYPPGFSTKGTGISTQSGYYPSPGTSMQDPASGRYAAFNAADNIATLIRQDTTLKPMLFVIGLSYPGGVTEPLDSDWLARVANDPNYITVGVDPNVVAAGQKVYQSAQTPGMYCLATPATLPACFAQVTSALLRLTQ